MKQNCWKTLDFMLKRKLLQEIFTQITENFEIFKKNVGKLSVNFEAKLYLEIFRKISE